MTGLHEFITLVVVMPVFIFPPLFLLHLILRRFTRYTL